MVVSQWTRRELKCEWKQKIKGNPRSHWSSCGLAEVTWSTQPDKRQMPIWSSIFLQPSLSLPDSTYTHCESRVSGKAYHSACYQSPLHLPVACGVTPGPSIQGLLLGSILLSWSFAPTPSHSILSSSNSMPSLSTSMFSFPIWFFSSRKAMTFHF